MTIAIVAVVVVLLLILAFRLVWRVAEPNEALIISGLGAHGSNDTSLDSLGFKIVVGRGTAVIPGFQTVRRLGLDIRATGLIVNAVSNQSIPLQVKGVVAYKVGDDLASIANAARRFLQQDADAMRGTIHELFAGHLRAIVGGMSAEDMLHNREELTANIRSSLADDLSKLGLVVDSLQIQEIDDDFGYIDNLGKPQAAAIAAAARIAAAERDKEATQREQAANAEKAAAVRESSIKQAGYQAEVDQAQSRALQSGPLAEALARQEVVRAETAAAELDAARREKVLESEVRKPADAEAYRQVTLADAARQTEILRAQAQAQETTLRGEAEAKATEVNGRALAMAIEARGRAEAVGIEARAAALASNPDAVIAQQIAEHYPAIVTAGASALGNIDNLVVLNGADGMEDLLGKALTMGGAGLGLARSLMSSIQGPPDQPSLDSSAGSGSANGSAPASVPSAAAPAGKATG